MDKTFDNSNIEIRTKRLLLRPFKHSDLSDFFEYASVPGVGEMAGWPCHTSVNESQNILNLFIEEKNVFAIVDGDKVIGSIGVESTNKEHYPELDDLNVKELGFVLSKAYWGMGLVPEAAEALIKYLFDVFDADCLTCCSFNFNSQSARVQHKLGFVDCKSFIYETRMGTKEESTGRVLWNKRVPLNERVYRYLLTIPCGKVASYGDIATWLGDKKLARVVGNILHNNPEPDKYPCYKVVNSQGCLAKNFGLPGGMEEQGKRLEKDGIVVVDGKVDIKKYLYVAY